MAPIGRIDTQHHFLPPKYLAATDANAIARTLLAGRVPAWTPDHSLRAMDRHGIATAVVSIAAPGFIGPDAATLCRDCNDYAADMTRDFPGRFGWFAGLPLPDVDASLAEMSRALDALEADGICLLTSYAGRYLGDPMFAPLFDALAARRAVVYVHPTEPPGSILNGLPPASLEYPFDTTRAIANLLASGTFARTHDISYIFSHAGGAISVLVERLARLERLPAFRQAVPDGVRAEVQRLHFDIALSAGDLTLGALLRLTSPDRILFASDFPYAPEEAMRGAVAGLGEAGLSPTDLALIEHDNAVRLMPRLGVKPLPYVRNAATASTAAGVSSKTRWPVSGRT